MSKEQEQIEKLAAIVDRLIWDLDQSVGRTVYSSKLIKKKLEKLHDELKTMKP